jgi:hypothetical protein
MKKHEGIVDSSYQHEAKHCFWYLFWCIVTGLVTGYGTYKLADHMEKAGYWRGCRVTWQAIDNSMKDK